MKISRTSIPAGKGRAGIVIGCRYTGKYAGHVDTTTGVYWEALPKIGGEELALQQALLAKPRPVRERVDTTVGAALAQFTERRLKPRASLPGPVGMQK